MPNPEWMAFAVVAALLGYFGFRFFKYRGFRGAFYGSRLVRTVGELQLQPFLGISTKLRVHVLEDGRIVLEKSRREV